MKPRDEKLMRLHDGELAEAEALSLRGELSDADQAKLLALAELDEALADTLSKESEDIDLWSRIEARLPPVPVEAEARPGGEARPLGVLSRARFLSRTRVTAVMTALAMAATFLIWLRPLPGPTNDCDVESLEVAGSLATVMKLPGEGGDSVTLIWMDHKETDEWESLD